MVRVHRRLEGSKFVWRQAGWGHAGLIRLLEDGTLNVDTNQVCNRSP